MSKIFDELDFNPSFQTDNEYAKNYDKWRNKEELNKFKTKYGEDIGLEESSSSSEDEDGVELSENLEKDFFKTLACLKNKDPRIYDENVQFFTENDEEGKKMKKKKDKVISIKDYERNLLLETGGILSDDEEDEGESELPRSPTYVEEQRQIKDNLKKALENVDEDNEDDKWGGIFEQRQKTKDDKDKEEAEYKQWLIGQKKHLDDKTVESELKPLKDYWNKPDLNEDEKFLRDYILKKKFLDKDEEDYVPTYDEIVHDSDEDLSNDEENVVKQEEFEHKFNFRFEEPDQEFIKQFPRTLENSLRRKDDRRKVKRQEVKERKKSEKEEKMRELKKLQELKRKEIEEKLEKLKEITGNETLGFSGEDIDGDFDPEEHDRKMTELFSEEYYAGEEDDQKPQFPELDEELEIENWERYTGETEDGPHCEDEDFNMDCDYDPRKSTQNELIENSRGRKKRKRKSKFSEALGKPKPKYDPSDRNYEEYFDEYYKLDCEDIVGDIPCRFKYRKVVPNDFGLTTEEILLANERELNKWCSLKKAIQIRPDHVEKYEQMAYKKKGQNIDLKKRILPSLFSSDPGDRIQQKVVPDRSSNKEEEAERGQNKLEDIGGVVEKNVSQTSEANADQSDDEIEVNKVELGGNQPNVAVKNEKKKKTPSLTEGGEQIAVKVQSKKKRKKTSTLTRVEGISQVVAKVAAKKKGKKHSNLTEGGGQISQIAANVESEKEKKTSSLTAGEQTTQTTAKVESKKKKKKLISNGTVGTPMKENSKEAGSPGKSEKTMKRKRKNSDKDGAMKKTSKKAKISELNEGNKLSGLSDARLAAYGLNPKKFKNKLKYKK